MVGCACITLVGINASHEVSLNILRQSLDDMYRLVVLALGIGDVYRFVFVYEYAGITHLTSHLSIERSAVENKLIVRVLLLCHLAVAQYMTFIFRVVVAHKLLLARTNLNPVAVLHSRSVASTLFLLLHLGLELLLVNTYSALTTDKLCKVERESVCVKQTERLGAVEYCLALSLNSFDGGVQHVDTVR